MLPARWKAILNEAARIGTFLLKPASVRRFRSSLGVPKAHATGLNVHSSGPDWGTFQFAAGNAGRDGSGPKTRLRARSRTEEVASHEAFARRVPAAGSKYNRAAAPPRIGERRVQNDEWRVRPKPPDSRDPFSGPGGIQCTRTPVAQLPAAALRGLVWAVGRPVDVPGC